MQSKEIFVLKVDIEKAFPKFPIPSDLLIFKDDPCEFSIELITILHGKPWTAVDIDDWRTTVGISLVKNYLTPLAFHYYLPSVLIGSIDKPSFLSYGLEALLPNNQKHIPKGEWWVEFRNCFNSNQKKIINKFLLLAMDLCTEHSEDEALIDAAMYIWIEPA